MQLYSPIVLTLEGRFAVGICKQGTIALAVCLGCDIHQILCQILPSRQ